MFKYNFDTFSRVKFIKQYPSIFIFTCISVFVPLLLCNRNHFNSLRHISNSLKEEINSDSKAF